jgi:hypothetical protein
LITTLTSVSTLHKFPARKPFKCSIQNSRRMVLKEVHIPACPTNYSNAFNSFQLSSFNVNGYIFPKSNFKCLCDKRHSQDSSVPLTDYFQYCLFNCARTHLTCCFYCSVKSHSFCLDKCSACASRNYFFYFVLNRYDGYMNLIHHIMSTT